MLVGHNKRFYVGSSAFLGTLKASPQYSNQRCTVKEYLSEKERFRVAFWDPSFGGKEVLVHESNLTFDFWAAPALLLPPLAPGLRVADVGTSGNGLLSSREYQEGEVILEERPMMVVSNKDGLASRWNLYFGTECDIGEKAGVLVAFQELSDGNATEAFMGDAKALFKNMFGVAEDGAEAHVQRMAGKSFLDSQVRRIAGVLARWQSNCHTLTLPGSQEKHSALYRYVSKANHSCDANCSTTLDKSTGNMILKAKRQIVPGEQLTANYLSADPKFKDLPVQERRRQLSKRGFFCLCSRCTKEGDIAASSMAYDWPAKEDCETSDTTAPEFLQECEMSDTNTSEAELLSQQSIGRSQEEPGGAQEEPGGSQTGQEEPRRSQEEPGLCCCSCQKYFTRKEFSTKQLKKVQLRKCKMCTGSMN